MVSFRTFRCPLILQTSFLVGTFLVVSYSKLAKKIFRKANRKINPMHCGMQLSSILRSHNRKVKKRFLQIMFHCFKVLLVPHCFLHKTPTGIGMAWAQSGHPYMTSPNSPNFLTPPSPMSPIAQLKSRRFKKQDEVK